MSKFSASWDEWAVEYGDGEIDGPYTDRAAAERVIRFNRKDIADGHLDADDYEPMGLVHRIWTQSHTEWTAMATTEPMVPQVAAEREEV